MSLIKCPECGKEQSSFAETCAYCSFPLEKYALNPEKFSWENNEEINVPEEETVIVENEEFEPTLNVKETSDEDNKSIIAEEIKDDFQEIDEDIEDVALDEGVIEVDDDPRLFINMGLIHKIIDWILSVFIIFISIAPLMGGSIVTGIMWLVGGFLLMPIPSLLSMWDVLSHKKKRWRRPLIVFFVLFIAIFFA